jgi:hypothetical protein
VAHYTMDAPSGKVLMPIARTFKELVMKSAVYVFFYRIKAL